MIRSTIFKRVLTATVIVLLAYLAPLGIGKWLRDTTTGVVRPIGHTLIVNNVSLYNSYNNFKQLGSLRESKSKLELQVLELQKQVTEQESVKRENETLRKEVGVTGITKEAKKLLGRIIVKGNDPLNRTMTVDVGSADGVAEGLAAISEGALVGKVIEVREHSSVVRALTSQKSKVQVWLVTNREKGFLSGTGNGLILTDITQGIAVTPVSPLETSGLGGSLPQGILVGETVEALSKQSDLSQSFNVKASRDPQALESLFIVLSQ